MYNIFYKHVGQLSFDGIDSGVFVTEYRVYKSDNKNTLRRLGSHEGWIKYYPNSVCDRKVAIAERNRMVAADEKRLLPLLEHIDTVRKINKKP
jgi:hypothetical protein